MSAKDCIFCQIVKGQAPAAVRYEDDDVLAFDNINPASEIHILIIPKKHTETFMDIDDPNILIPMQKAAQIIIESKNLKDGYKLVFNGGKYQAVPHLHWHLLAGKLNDGKDILNKT